MGAEVGYAVGDLVGSVEGKMLDSCEGKAVGAIGAEEGIVSVLGVLVGVKVWGSSLGDRVEGFDVGA